MLQPYHSALFAAADENPPGGGGSSADAPPSLAAEFTQIDPAKMSIPDRFRAAGNILAKGDGAINALNTKITDLTAANGALTSEKATLQTKYDEAMARISTLEAEAMEASSGMAGLLQENETLKATEKDLSKRADALSKERMGALGFKGSKLPKQDPEAEASGDENSKPEAKIRELTGTKRVQAALYFKEHGKLPDWMNN